MTRPALALIFILLLFCAGFIVAWGLAVSDSDELRSQLDAANEAHAKLIKAHAGLKSACVHVVEESVELKSACDQVVQDLKASCSGKRPPRRSAPAIPFFRLSPDSSPEPPRGCKPGQLCASNGIVAATEVSAR